MAFANNPNHASHGLHTDFSAAVYTAMQSVSNYRAYRRTVSELSKLGRTELADLGLHRSEIRRVATEVVYGK